MKGLVSICVPTYKQTVLLAKNLASIRQQNYRNVEVLISDDSPGYEVQDLVKSYETQLPIRYVKNKVALGPPANWNAVLKMAKGDLILLLHHDDRFANENALADFVGELERTGADFVFGRNESIDALAGNKSFNGNYFNKLYSTPDLLIVQNILGAPSNILLKRNALAFYNDRFKWIVDVEFYTRLFKRGMRFAYIDKTLVITGRHEGQVTNECINNSDILVYENVLYAIDHVKKISNIQVFDFYWRLLRNTGVRHLNDLHKLGLDVSSVPHFIHQIIKYMKTSPEWAKRVGVSSKLLMTLCYLSTTISKRNFKSYQDNE